VTISETHLPHMRYIMSPLLSHVAPTGARAAKAAARAHQTRDTILPLSPHAPLSRLINCTVVHIPAGGHAALGSCVPQRRARSVRRLLFVEAAAARRGRHCVERGGTGSPSRTWRNARNAAAPNSRFENGNLCHLDIKQTATNLRQQTTRKKAAETNARGHQQRANISHLHTRDKSATWRARHANRRDMPARAARAEPPQRWRGDAWKDSRAGIATLPRVLTIH